MVNENRFVDSGILVFLINIILYNIVNINTVDSALQRHRLMGTTA